MEEPQKVELRTEEPQKAEGAEQAEDAAGRHGSGACAVEGGTPTHGSTLERASPSSHESPPSRHGGGAKVEEKPRSATSPLSSAETVIMKATSLRREYRVAGPPVRVAPMQIGFHPENRGGQAPSGERCNALLKDILAVGFDAVEADTNGVLLQERVGERKILDFNQQACVGEDSLAPVAESGLSFGSLSHSHLNQVLKNILQRIKSDAVGITDADGRLSLELLRAKDQDFAKACVDGLLWEILEPRMLDEHPDAANIIQLALNSKNKIHMAQHEMEVLSQLWRICGQASSVGDRLSLQQAKKELRQVMPQLGDDDDIKAAFRFVIDMGGDAAPFLQDLQDFHVKHVDSQVPHDFLIN